ncbi:hypothetical protein UA08_03158 [Talaromyces atroroseus]|uniref:Homeobox domain-containing protein n=1 Tax=Talaromyces atroroseus TaxID=1441469 RepID=A0A225AIC0_TALAT|nr:hypothetical protein UA08_03158 [Talaromyces atroroseus]OKL61192.1 hypothetical protein UA08_03158 [Talaromyces atroroseus]
MISVDPSSSSSSSLSSTTAASSSPPQSYGSSPANLHYAFLVHSQKTLTQNLPPRVDNKLLARQKRRRTSPEDHAILEAEYKKNPKPDKVARVSIVNQVSLGEKEVQIWFQNRRQNDRRKSKPLEPHELVGPRASNGTLQDFPNSHDTCSLDSSPQQGTEQGTPELLEKGSSAEDILPITSDGDVSGKHPDSNANNPEPDTPATSVAPETSVGGHIENFADLAGLGIHVAGKKRRFSNLETGSRAVDTQLLQNNIKSPPSLRISLSGNGEALLRQKGELTPSPPRARTAVRISLSSDGEALIRTQDEPSPSKNRLRILSRAPRKSGLQRSVSAINFGTPGATPINREGAGIKPFGRSRDARTWESYCDNDARSALSTPTNSQSAGSVRTPGLYRSGSHRSLARGSVSKSSVSPHFGTVSQQDGLGVSGEKRRKLSRTVSSLGRLESAQQGSNLKNGLAARFPLTGKASKDSSEDVSWEAGDSDKENWMPGTQRRAIPRRHARALSHTQRPILKENGVRRNTAVDDLALAKHGRLYRGPRGTKDMKDTSQATNKLDAEVAAFMSKNGSSSREEDLHCIQGLLSLSQGAWR